MDTMRRRSFYSKDKRRLMECRADCKAAPCGTPARVRYKNTHHRSATIVTDLALSPCSAQSFHTQLCNTVPSCWSSPRGTGCDTHATVRNLVLCNPSLNLGSHALQSCRMSRTAVPQEGNNTVLCVYAQRSTKAEPAILKIIFWIFPMCGRSRRFGLFTVLLG